jgi:uncharacterized protein (DUF1697 family)
MGDPAIDRYIALYRGINVGAVNRVRMESLRAMHERLGHRDVASYIQSGNIVFSASGPTRTIARKIAAAFHDEFGFAARVIVTMAARWDAIVRDNPFATFSAKHPQTVHVGFCEGEPNANGLRVLHGKAGGTESFAVKGDVIYLHAPDGLGRSKFAAGMEKACGAPTTLRNWRTIDALGKMLDRD